MTAIAEVLHPAAEVDDLHGRVRGVCARLNRAHADLVDVTVELIDTGLWAEGGIRSPEHWLVVRAALSPARAKEIVLLARRQAELPETSAALRAGTVSVDQAAVVARHVPATHSRSAQELAQFATVTQLRRVLPTYSFTMDESAPAPDPIDEQPQLQMSTLDGRFTLRYSGPASTGAVIETAIREAKDRLFIDGATDASLADGLVEVATRSLGAVECASRVDKFRIYVHLDTSGGWIGRGDRLPKHILERLTCEGQLQPVWETDGKPVNVGRSQRIVPRRSRRLIEARDRGCRFPGCTARGGHVEVHHIRHWVNGGGSNTWELVLLCAYHHDAHHRGEFSVSGDADDPAGLTFTGHGGGHLDPLTAGPPNWPVGTGTCVGTGTSTSVTAGVSTGTGVWTGDSTGRTTSVGRSTGTALRIVTPPTGGPDPGPPLFTGPTGERLHRTWVSLPDNTTPSWFAKWQARRNSRTDPESGDDGSD